MKITRDGVTVNLFETREQVAQAAKDIQNAGMAASVHEENGGWYIIAESPRGRRYLVGAIDEQAA